MDPDDSATSMDWWAAIHRAKSIVMTRRQCTGDEAMLLMIRSAESHEMHLHQLAECVVADLELGGFGQVEEG